MSEDAFREELGMLLQRLGEELGLATPRIVIVEQARRATMAGNELRVPRSYERHHARFGVLPTALVRDMAYEAKKATSAGVRDAVEADSIAYAEQFLRRVMETD